LPRLSTRCPEREKRSVETEMIWTSGGLLRLAKTGVRHRADLATPCIIEEVRLVQCVLLASICLTQPACQSPLAQSHIDANVPDAKVFGPLMERDLQGYFEKTLDTTEKIHVQFQLLRDGPTQTGISYPKFYVWAKILSGDRILTEGAVRVAAVDRTQFNVTDAFGKSPWPISAV
jgi:hypothetical protein